MNQSNGNLSTDKEPLSIEIYETIVYIEAFKKNYDNIYCQRLLCIYLYILFTTEYSQITFNNII